MQNANSSWVALHQQIFLSVGRFWGDSMTRHAACPKIIFEILPYEVFHVLLLVLKTISVLFIQ
jgi:hypothetical protein